MNRTSEPRTAWLISGEIISLDQFEAPVGGYPGEYRSLRIGYVDPKLDLDHYNIYIYIYS